jgi:hypothetical protein
MVDVLASLVGEVNKTSRGCSTLRQARTVAGGAGSTVSAHFRGDSLW